jgi:hypothetical protein
LICTIKLNEKIALVVQKNKQTIQIKSEIIGEKTDIFEMA